MTPVHPPHSTSKQPVVYVSDLNRANIVVVVGKCANMWDKLLRKKYVYSAMYVKSHNDYVYSTTYVTSYIYLVTNMEPGSPTKYFRQCNSNSLFWGEIPCSFFLGTYFYVEKWTRCPHDLSVNCYLNN